jgi:hypothetical protein
VWNDSKMGKGHQRDKWRKWIQVLLEIWIWKIIPTNLYIVSDTFKNTWLSYNDYYLTISSSKNVHIHELNVLSLVNSHLENEASLYVWIGSIAW